MENCEVKPEMLLGQLLVTQMIMIKIISNLNLIEMMIYLCRNN